MKTRKFNNHIFISFSIITALFISCSNNDEPIIDLPMVNSVEITDIMYNQVTVKGSILSNGGDSIIEQGVCWSQLPNPTIDDFSKKNIPNSDADYLLEIQDLSSNIEYSVCAYAINSEGIAYGEPLTFTLWLNHPDKSVTDIDNNTYSTIRIGDQVWMQENLNVTRYRNGDPISYITMQDDKDWLKTTSGAFCAYNDDSEIAEKYGYLYNGYAIFDERNICPEGWHVPTKEEIETLLNYLGGRTAAGHMLKNRSGWDDLHSKTNNLSGFSALPGGARLAFRYEDDENTKTYFSDGKKKAFFASQESSESAYRDNLLWYIQIFNDGGDVQLNDNITLRSGQSIRCIKD